jgi:hypothetical protein
METVKRHNRRAPGQHSFSTLCPPRLAFELLRADGRGQVDRAAIDGGDVANDCVAGVHPAQAAVAAVVGGTHPCGVLLGGGGLVEPRAFGAAHWGWSRATAAAAGAGLLHGDLRRAQRLRLLPHAQGALPSCCDEARGWAAELPNFVARTPVLTGPASRPHALARSRQVLWRRVRKGREGVDAFSGRRSYWRLRRPPAAQWRPRGGGWHGRGRARVRGLATTA